MGAAQKNADSREGKPGAFSRALACEAGSPKFRQTFILSLKSILDFPPPDFLRLSPFLCLPSFSFTNLLRP